MEITKIKLKSILIFLLFGLVFVSCNSHLHLEDDYIDVKWKKESMINLAERFMKYKESHDLDRKRHGEIDLFMKFEDINRYPFGVGFKKLQQEIKSKKIKFDSIMCLTTQTSRSFDPEYLYPNYFYIFNNDKLIKVLIFEPTTLELTESDNILSNLEEMFLTDYKKTDGDDLSLLIFTKIRSDWQFEISKIVINSYW
ncbi:MAG TPA: hypothetical protein PKD16_10480 [Saprospiraceae bacterium]|jgi:hypothetical protein|nr:hypothetical protein [Saprospiraceae bacterium]HMT70578.1 hypothetical protein [Saprospiraceae bacterium]